jgi:hypothetical protein
MKNKCHKDLAILLFKHIKNSAPALKQETRYRRAVLVLFKQRISKVRWLAANDLDLLGHFQILLKPATQKKKHSEDTTQRGPCASCSISHCY